jgi:hypothetical protein
MAKGRLGTMSRRQARSLTKDMVDQFPRELQERLAPHIDEYAEQLLWGMRHPTLDGQYGPVSNPGHRTAMDLIAQIMKAVGSSQTIVNALILQLGVPLEQAREAVQLVEDIPEDPHEQAREARRFLAWYEGPDGPGPEAL